MPRFAGNLAAIAALVVVLFFLPSAHAADDAVARGRYLVETGSCSNCHAPLRMGSTGPAWDLSRGLSGHPQDVALPPPPASQGPWVSGSAATNTAFYGPWGTSYAANLTPDVQTGIGAWTVDDFVKAMRTGKHLGVGRRILPPMPWKGLAAMTDADLQAIFGYLVSMPAVRNAVPDVVVAPRP